MDILLLLELRLYIENNIREGIIIDEAGSNYIEPLKSYILVPKVEEGGDGLYSEGIISEEEELIVYIYKERSNETFTSKLLQYIDSSGFSDAEIYKKAGIDRRHFSKIRCHRHYQPKKATAIALCIALQLSLKETEELLQLAGYSLSNSDTGDLVVKFCIEREIYDLFLVNEALDYFDQRLLGVV